ncbi:toll-like receptor 6 [Crassostrea virginica]
MLSREKQIMDFIFLFVLPMTLLGVFQMVSSMVLQPNISTELSTFMYENVTNMSTEKLNKTTSIVLPGSLPPAWEEFCSLQGKDSYHQQPYYHYSCYIDQTSTGKWNFSQLRTYISTSNASYSFNVQCQTGAKISLPYQNKASNIIKLTVYNCVTVDYFLDFKNHEIDSMPDAMEELRLINVQKQIRVSDFKVNLNLKTDTLPGNLICGDEETLKIVIKRNCSFIIDFDAPIDLNLFGIIATGNILDSRRSSHKCVFKQLQTLEISVETKSRYYVNDLTEQRLYPELKILNVSYSDIYYIPEQFKNWWIYFETLEYIDMSHNRIQDILFPVNLEGIWGKPIPSLTYDITHNEISKVSVRMFERLVSNKKIFVNISDNPFNCTCSNEMTEVLKFIRETDWSSERYQRYQYLRDLRCHIPQRVNGRRLRELTNNDINCEFELMPVTLALSVLSFLLIIIMIVILKYRREIRILFFTRFNVVLPCQPEELYEEKEFDAFISYSNEDQKWVLDLFEDNKPERIAHLKFCMHQKDFVPGKTIFENIVKCVENSNHTIIILSQNFLNSNFCMWEFQEAFQQSIVERKRHLIIILLEDIPEREVPNDLKRCMKTFTYIKKDDNIFIDRLLFSLSYKGKGKVAKVGHVNTGYVEDLPQEEMNDMVRINNDKNKIQRNNIQVI